MVGNKKQKISEGTYAQKLFLSDYMRESLIGSVIEFLQLPAGSRGLDAGCPQ
jgi:hypothetical protein